ncbi:MAG: sulfatase [Gemmatales bacterium]|nr:MAG: sulfatase [Gemmatales bacterium]
MHPLPGYIQQTRREFLTSASSGIGLLALSSLLRDEGLLAAEAENIVNPLAPKPPHFPAKAKACICLFMAGAPSQLDLFDPKPKLNELDGQKLPESMTKNVRFAFIQKDSARLMGSPREFKKYGQCGMELSDLLPHLSRCVDDIALIRSMHTEAFNHHPGQLMMNCGVPKFGFPSMGSWINYGLGSESQNLPGYVVLTAGRGSSGGASNWSSGFLPTTYQGVLFRNQGEPVLNLNNPSGLSRRMQQKTIDTLRKLNTLRQAGSLDPEIHSRIAAYELAFRMQQSAPELIDLSKESKRTLEMYGVERKDPPGGGRGGGGNVYRTYATNCLLARRLVERGVRFVTIMHASWDHHSNLDRELAFNAGMCDQPIAALIQDLKQRGLLDSTLVMWVSEFGRTPLGENRRGFKKVTGRDHHPFAFSVWLAGGGVRGGQVVGQSDEIGWHAIEDKMHINDFHATILALFGFDHLKLTYRFQGRDFRLTDVAGKVVPKLIA